MSLPRQMIIGFGVGLIAGLLTYFFTGGESEAVSWVMTYITGPIGQVFLRLLMMLVIPLVFSALVVGVATMGDASQLAVLGGRMATFTVLSTSLAVVTGLFLMNLFQPGVGFDQQLQSSLIEGSAGRVAEIIDQGAQTPTLFELILGVVPTNIFAAVAQNDILAVLFVSLFFGVALVVTNTAETRRVLKLVQGLFDISMTMTNWVIRLAPVAVACLVFNSLSLFGWELLVRLSGFVGVTLLAMSVHAFIFYPTMIILAGRDPLEIFRGGREALLMGFSTSSSSATMPTTLRVAETELGLPSRITRFVVTVGATANSNATAMFEGITVLFLAQLAGVELTLAQQIVMMVVCVFGGVGTAGIPAGSLPVIAMICMMFGIPPEGLGIILGVDRFLDMCRTTINVGGDLVASVVLTAWDERSQEPSMG